MVEVEAYVQNFLLGGSGALVSTAFDLNIWNNKLYEHLVFSQKLSDLMLTEHVQMDPNDASIYYCYGIAKEKHINGDIFTHDGGLPGFMSKLAYRPFDRVSLVVLSNLNIYTCKIDEVLKRVGGKVKRTGDHKKYSECIDRFVEEEIPGFQVAKRRHELLSFSNF